MSEKGVLASLFDLSFTSLITTRVITLIYALCLAGIGVGAIAFCFSAFRVSGGLGMLTLLVLAPLGALLYAITTRVMLEIVVAIFRIAESNRDIAHEVRAARVGSAGSAPLR